MKKAGMTMEGILKGYFYSKNNRYCDVVMYTVLKDK